MKLSLFSLSFSLLILLASCTKENITTPSGNYGENGNPAPANATTSDWVSASSLTWSNASASSNVFTTTNWDAPQLTQEIIDNGGLFIYVQASGSSTPKLLPAILENSGNSDYDEYRSNAEPKVIHLSHSKYVNGDYATPIVNNDVNFRYILINNLESSNGRIIANNGIEYYMNELRMMSYDEVVIALGINEN